MTDIEALVKGGCDSDQLQKALDQKTSEKKEEYTTKRVDNVKNFGKDTQAQADQEKLKRGLETKIQVQLIEEATKAEKNKYEQQIRKDEEKAMDERKALERASNEKMQKEKEALSKAYGERISELSENKKEITEKLEKKNEEIENLLEEHGRQEQEEKKESRDLRESLAKKKNDADEKRMEEILDSNKATLETQIDNEKEIASKQMASIENEKALQERINEERRIAHTNLIKMKALSFKNAGIKQFNETVKCLQDQKDDLKRIGDKCAVHLIPGDKLKDEQRSEAINRLENLRNALEITNKTLKRLGEDVMELSDETKHEEYSKQIKQVKEKIGLLGTSIALFEGRITRNLNWEQDEMDEFNKLLNGISKGIDEIQLMKTLEAKILALTEKSQPSLTD
uniref:Uncharacterized protein n=1 Tax=Caenorhabditis tropicalis TaxID=1561998 RepID=A0A1I7UGG8_9PELO